MLYCAPLDYQSVEAVFVKSLNVKRGQIFQYYVYFTEIWDDPLVYNTFVSRVVTSSTELLIVDNQFGI